MYFGGIKSKHVSIYAHSEYSEPKYIHWTKSASTALFHKNCVFLETILLNCS